MADEVIHLRVQQDTYEVSMQDLTWGELSELEEMLGGSLEDVNLASAKGVLALAFIAVRRVKPAVTLDSLKALPMTEIEFLDAVPTSADEVGEDENSGSQD